MSYQVIVMLIEVILFTITTIVIFKFTKKRNNGSIIFSLKAQIIIGVIYGIFACVFSIFGFDVNGAIQNIRDSAPLTAGIIFGPVSGIVAGSIGAIHRFFFVSQATTRIACTIGTFLAGCIAALVKKCIIGDRIPSAVYAFVVGFVAEVAHLLMVFITQCTDVATAIAIIHSCAKLMLPMVATAVTLPILYLRIENIIKNKNNNNDKPKRTIADDIQLGLLVSVIIAFITTNVFVIKSQNDLAYTNAMNAMKQTIEDLRNDVINADFDNLSKVERETYLADDIAYWHIGSTGYMTIFREDGAIVTSSDHYIPKDNDNVIDYIPDIFEQQKDTVIKIESNGDTYYMYSKITDGYYVIAVYPSSEANLNRDFSIITTIFFEIIILAILFFMIYLLIRIVVVNKIGKINDDLARISRGNLDVEINVRNNSEFDILSDDINATVLTLKKFIEEAKTRIDAELKFARDIQNSALPNTFPISKRFDLYATMMPAKQVGGDFYDFYRVDDDRIAILVADVSGKGVPAALFMMKAKTLIKGLVEAGCSPADAFTKANYELCENNEVELFVTAWLGILNVRTGDLTYVNAGHNPPIVGRQDTSAQFMNQKPGFVLGGIEGIHYKEFETKLSAGEGLFLYTDGVTEATNANNELYGEDRLLKVLNDVTAVNMRYLTKVIKDDIDEFVGDAPQFDDITMLAIRLKEKTEQNALFELNPRDPESIDILNSKLDIFVENTELPIKVSSKMMIIVDEIYSNIVNYSRAKIAKVRVLIRNGLLSLAFADDGIYYNPLEKEDPDITLSAEEREIGGLGIFMTKRMSEDIKYTRQGGFNILDVVIRIDE